jgi:hypothetical protein
MIKPEIAPISDPYNDPEATANNSITGIITLNGRMSLNTVVCNPSKISDTKTNRVQRLPIICNNFSLTAPFAQ